MIILTDIRLTDTEVLVTGMSFGRYLLSLVSLVNSDF